LEISASGQGRVDFTTSRSTHKDPLVIGGAGSSLPRTPNVESLTSLFKAMQWLMNIALREHRKRNEVEQRTRNLSIHEQSNRREGINRKMKTPEALRDGNDQRKRRERAVQIPVSFTTFRD